MPDANATMTEAPPPEELVRRAVRMAFVASHQDEARAAARPEAWGAAVARAVARLRREADAVFLEEARLRREADTKLKDNDRFGTADTGWLRPCIWLAFEQALIAELRSARPHQPCSPALVRAAARVRYEIDAILRTENLAEALVPLAKRRRTAGGK
jgi:hypothetical protein